MVIHADSRAPRSVLPQLTRLIDSPWSGGAQSRTKARLLVAHLRKVGHEQNAIKLRIARVLHRASTWDVAEVGCSNWASFLKEYARLSPSQARAWTRLVASRLYVVIEALQNGQITLDQATSAIQTLGNDASEEAQRAFLHDLPSGGSPKRPRASMDWLAGDDRLRVLEARHLGGTLIGSDAPIAVIDDFLVDCHVRQRTCEEILSDANKVPPVPDRLGKVILNWSIDPAEGLLGTWIEPANIQQAAAQLRRLEWLRALRRVALARGYSKLRSERLWTDLPDCKSLAECCVKYLAMSQRTLERYAEEGLRYARFPSVRKEIQAGRLTIDRASYAMSHSTNEVELDSWLDALQQIGRAELHHAATEYAAEDLRELYAPELAFAKEVRESLRPSTRTSAAGRPTQTSATAARVADHLRGVGSTGTVQVALRDGRHKRSPPREPGYLLAPSKLLEAAKYVLRVVKLPATYGVRRTVTKDRYTCQNPRCRRRTLRVHPHHMHQRRYGGSDHPWNIVTLCEACHLRLVHGGHMDVVRFDDFLVWTWACDNSVVVMYSPVDTKEQAA